MNFELLENQVIIMFNIFKKTKQFTSYLELHKAIEQKMSKLAAEDVLNTLRISTMQEVVNNQVNYYCYSEATLAKAAEQMERAARIMTKATATLIKDHQNGQQIAFEDKTIYTYITNAKALVSVGAIPASKSRDSLIFTITDSAKTLMSLERSMLLELTAYAKAENQAVTVRG